MRGQNVLMSSARTEESSEKDNWETPESFLELVRATSADEQILLDPCTTPDNPTGAMFKFTADDDGLGPDRSWSQACGGMTFMNPPYSKVRHWLRKAVEEFDRNFANHRMSEMVILTASRTDTIMFHDLAIPHASGVCFWKGRIIFVGASHGATFPSAVFYFGERFAAFRRVFGEHGLVIPLDNNPTGDPEDAR